MLYLMMRIKDYSNIPVVSYISDVFYTNNQFRFSPLFWVKHFLLRKSVRKAFSFYDLVYTMTDVQKEQCIKDINCNIKILRKYGNFDESKIKKKVNSPIKIIYAGGILY